MTYDEIGLALGVSRERARQIERIAIAKIRRYLRRNGQLRDWSHLDRSPEPHDSPCVTRAECAANVPACDWECLTLPLPPLSVVLDRQRLRRARRARYANDRP